MGKKLAIKGHVTRGNEVIELLEMMGGNEGLSDTGLRLGGTEVCCIYHIGTGGSIIYSHHSAVNDDFIVFTLEEFLEKYPYKVGDKIPDVWGNSCTVKSMSWDENYKTVMYGFKETIFVARGDEMYLTNIINNHTKPSKMKTVLAELLEHIKTTPKEELEREFEEIKEWSNVGPSVEEFMTFCECVNKKPVYPKTFKECRAILNCMEGNMTGYKASLFASLQDLLICRDAYWKIAGEEMGLDKPWKPDWTSGYPVYCISVSGNTIGKGKWYTDNKILAFPTEEIRDVFYENFKDLIEQCKELL